MNIRPQDKETLAYLIRNGSTYGDEFDDIASRDMTASKLRACAKRYDGKVIRTKAGVRFRIDYLAPFRFNMSKATPGIENPRTGICAPQKAQVAIVRLKSK